ncbi:protein IWS1 homolog 1-like isoform X2 [Magnolia sinica]|nr:protein IWS1 homolog 1-like isoform X2 [Magnolia sinica]
MARGKAAGLESRDYDLDLAEFSQEPKSGQSSSRPEALPLDFVVRPPSKIDPEIRAWAKQVIQDQHRLKMEIQLMKLLRNRSR